MHLKPFLLAVTLLILSGTATAQHSIPTEGFACFNLRYDKNWSGLVGSEANWGEYRRLIPVGSKVKLDRHFGRSQAGWSTIPTPNTYVLKHQGLDEITIKHQYVPKNNLQGFISRFICAEDPRKRLDSASETVKHIITLGRVGVGMTKDEVIFSLGLPFPDEAYDLNDNSWTYYWGSFDRIRVNFSDAGLVRTVSGPDFALADMLFPIPAKK